MPFVLQRACSVGRRRRRSAARSGRPPFTIVTSVPKRANIWPNSRPTGPRPRTRSDSRQLVSSSAEMWSIQSTASMPSIGGTEVREPVEIRIRSGLQLVGRRRCTVCGPMKRRLAGGTVSKPWLELARPMRLRPLQRVLPVAQAREVHVRRAGLDADPRRERVHVVHKLRGDEVRLRRLAGHVRAAAAPALLLDQRDRAPCSPDALFAASRAAEPAPMTIRSNARSWASRRMSSPRGPFVTVAWVGSNSRSKSSCRRAAGAGRGRVRGARPQVPPVARAGGADLRPDQAAAEDVARRPGSACSRASTASRADPRSDVDLPDPDEHRQDPRRARRPQLPFSALRSRPRARSRSRRRPFPRPRASALAGALGSQARRPGPRTRSSPPRRGRVIARGDRGAARDAAGRHHPPRRRGLELSEEVRNALELSETNQRVLLHRARAKVRACARDVPGRTHDARKPHS